MRGAADEAVADLEAAGMPRQHISRIDDSASSGTGASTGGTGFLDFLKDMFMPEEDRYGYAEPMPRMSRASRYGFSVMVATASAP